MEPIGAPKPLTIAQRSAIGPAAGIGLNSLIGADGAATPRSSAPHIAVPSHNRGMQNAPIDGGEQFALPLPSKPIRTLPIATKTGGATTTGGSQGGVSQGGAAPKLPANPLTGGAGTGSSNSGGAGLAGNGPLIDALTGALTGGGMENPLDAVSSPSTAALEALQPTAGTTQSSSNPALLFAVLGIAAIGVVFILERKRKPATPPTPHAPATDAR